LKELIGWYDIGVVLKGYAGSQFEAMQCLFKISACILDI
jgi:hypothetical protein